MTDKELLEAAAKAAGIEIREWADSAVHAGKFGAFLTKEGVGERTWWNPLTDDGDALRLAVSTGVLQGRGFDNAWTAMYAVGKLPKDKFEATRRAIVRAAADIGRTK